MEATVVPPPAVDRQLRAKIADRVPLNLYLEVLDGLLVRVTNDLQGMTIGSLSDTAPERTARQITYERLFSAREHLISAVDELQKIRDPDLKFPLGLVIVGSQLLDLGMRQQALQVVWTKHARGNWGDVTPREAASNNAGISRGGRLVSQHRIGRDAVVVITEADRSSTTIMLKDEY